MENNRKKTKWIILLILSALIFAVCAVILITHLIPPKDDYDEYKNTSSVTGGFSDLVLEDNPIDFAALKAENPDVCGWIKIDGTVIDYPVMRSGDDTPEDFYLNHDMKRTKKSAGSIYIQKYNSSGFTDANTILYGHNMLNGSMFAALKKYRNANFFNENRNITVYVPEHILSYEIFSAFVYDDRHILNSFNFYVEEEHQAFIDECLSPTSLIRNVRPDTAVTTDDKLITLSTCTSAEHERYLVVAVLKQDTLTK